MMRIFVVLASIVSLPHAGAAEPPHVSEKPPILLGVGEQRVLKTLEIARYSIGGSQVKAHPFPQNPQSPSSPLGSPDALLLKGISPGTVDLWIWKKDGSSEHRTLQVIRPSESSLSPPLEKALSGLEETEVIFIGLGTALGATLRGEVQTRTEWVKLGRLREAFPKEVVDETTLSPLLFEEGKQSLENWMVSSPYARILKIESGPDPTRDLWVRGAISHPKEKIEIERHLKRLFPTVLLDLSSHPDLATPIQFKVFLLELNRSSLRNLGLAWPSQISESLQISTLSLAGKGEIGWVLHQLEGKGDVKILSQPELVVRAPGEAEVFAGGEIPIETHSRFNSNVFWKSYGLTLKLKVSEVLGSQVRLDIFSEVSHIDPQISQDKLPGLQVNRMKTQVDATFETPLLLSGLLQSGIREEARGLPFLRSIPVLGKLFGSANYLNHYSEFVALLYPRIAPASLPAALRIQNFLPRGQIPLPRNWVDPSDENQLRNSENYPWNVLN